MVWSPTKIEEETLSCKKKNDLYPKILPLLLFIYFFYMNMLLSNPGCVCVYLSVCLSVCVCVSSVQPKRMNRFWWNSQQMIFRIFASVILRGFGKFKLYDVIAAILHLRVAALSWSQFCFDFLQNYGQCAINSFIVWYWKSARSVNNFWSKSGPRSSHIDALVSEQDSEVPGSNLGGGISFLWLWMFLVTK